MNVLTPDREMLSRFAGIMFKHASPKGYVSLRAFSDSGSREQKALFVYAITIGDKDFLDMLYEHARRAAEWHEPAVFCPPVATFRDPKNAKTDNLCEGVGLSVECDQSPLEARKSLESLLGPATVVVASGGEWTNPETGEIEPKVHLHWRLKKPTSTKAEHDLLREARELATKLVGGDDTNISIVHPIRWPGSWHRKGTPRLAKIVALSEQRDRPHRSARSSCATPLGRWHLAGLGFKANSRLCADDPAAVASASRSSQMAICEWDDWNKIGMAIWAATGGSEVGREAFAAWSAKSKKNVAETRMRAGNITGHRRPTALGLGRWCTGPGTIRRAGRYGSASDVERLNKVHAVLPIGGKTRVVTFGELEEFPGRETIVMTQTIADFKSLNNKYRHS